MKNQINKPLHEPFCGRKHKVLKTLQQCRREIHSSVIKKYFNERLKSSKGVLYGISPENIGYIYFKSFHNRGLIDKLPEIFNYLVASKIRDFFTFRVYS